MKRKSYSIVKDIFRLFPFYFFIGLIARATIVGSTLHYSESLGEVSIIIRICLILWVLMPFYFSIRNTYFEFTRNSFRQMHWGSFLIFLFASICTLGFFNIAMWIIDDITPKEFFGRILEEGF